MPNSETGKGREERPLCAEASPKECNRVETVRTPGYRPTVKRVVGRQGHLQAVGGRHIQGGIPRGVPHGVNSGVYPGVYLRVLTVVYTRVYLRVEQWYIPGCTSGCTTGYTQGCTSGCTTVVYTQGVYLRVCTTVVYTQGVPQGCVQWWCIPRVYLSPLGTTRRVLSLSPLGTTRRVLSPFSLRQRGASYPLSFRQRGSSYLFLLD